MRVTNSILILLIIVALTACHSLVEDTFLTHTETPTLNSILKPDSLINVHISLSTGLNDSTPSFIENAKVKIHSTEGWSEKLKYIGGGWYVSTHTSKTNETYTCQAEIEGFPTLFASTTVPNFTIIDTITFIPTVSKDEDGRDIAAIHFPIANDTNKLLYWEVRMFKKSLTFDWNDNSESSTKREVAIYMLAGDDVVLQNEGLPLTVFSNKKINQNLYNIVFYIPSWSLGSYSNGKLIINNSDNFFIELRSIDESYYRFQKQAYLYSTSGGTGLGSATQCYALYSNVNNGLGIFASFSSVSKKVELK